MLAFGKRAIRETREQGFGIGQTLSFGSGVAQQRGLQLLILTLKSILPVFGLGQNVQIPTGQARGKADVLAFFADGQRQLIVTHDDDRRSLRLSDTHPIDLRRAKSLGDEALGIFGPGNNINFFAVQLAHHRLNTGAFHANARTHRIHSAFFRPDRHLGAVTGITGNRLNGNDALGNLRHLHLEQFLHENRAVARQNQLGATRGFAHLQQQCANPVSTAIDFPRDLLGSG